MGHPRRNFRVQLYGYVVMPEHVHLLLSEPRQDTSSDRTAPLKPKPGLNGPPVRYYLAKQPYSYELKSVYRETVEAFLHIANLL